MRAVFAFGQMTSFERTGRQFDLFAPRGSRVSIGRTRVWPTKLQSTGRCLELPFELEAILSRVRGEDLEEELGELQSPFGARSR